MISWIAVVLRSRSGRWVQKWERIDRLCNFRMTTIPPGNPHYTDERICFHLEEATAQALNEVSRRARVARGLSADVDIVAIRRVVEHGGPEAREATDVQTPDPQRSGGD